MRRLLPALLIVVSPLLLSGFAVNAGVQWVQAYPLDERDYGFRITQGEGWDYAGGGYAGGHFLHLGNGVAEAEWVFGLLPDGDYDVQITWPSWEYLSSTVQYTVSDGNVPYASGSVDQRRPSGVIAADGVYWLSLGVHTFHEGAATVSLSAQGYLAADAVRVVPLGAVQSSPQSATFTPSF